MGKYSALIVSWNSEEVIGSALSSLLKVFAPSQIYVWDNASTDSSVSVAKRFGVRVIPYARNIGFSAAVNKFVKLHLSREMRYLFIFNPDIFWLSGDPDEIISYFNKFAELKSLLRETFSASRGSSPEEGKFPFLDSAAGVFSLGALLYYPERAPRDGEIRPAQFQVGSRAFSYDGFYFRVRNLPEELHYRTGFPVPTLFNTGGAMVVDLPLFRKLGGFDEIFLPGYWEDVDLCFRAMAEGYLSFVVPRWVVLHYEKHSMRKRYGDGISHISARNSYIFLWKNLRKNKAALLWRHFFDSFKDFLSGRPRFLNSFFSALLRYNFKIFRRGLFPEKFFEDVSTFLSLCEKIFQELV